MIHYCGHCDFKSNHKWVVRRHADTKHGLDNTPSTKDEDTPKVSIKIRNSI